MVVWASRRSACNDVNFPFDFFFSTEYELKWVITGIMTPSPISHFTFICFAAS